MAERPVVACKRCRLKKLKCDDEPITCSNCARAGLECLHIDTRSHREYSRGYIEQLLKRIKDLKEIINTPDAAETTTVPVPVPAPGVVPDPATNHPPHATYRGDGSVVSMARLVEAAISTPADDGGTVFDIGSHTIQTPDDTAEKGVNLAFLPPSESAQQLFNSYLNGLHLLHPFMHRPTLIRELEGAYAQQEALPAGSMFRIHMVFAIGAVSLVRAGTHHVSPVDYYATAMKYVEKTLGLSDLEHIQAVLLVLMFSLQHDVGIGSKWNLAQVAMKICVENGLHKKRVAGDLALEQMRRKVFWACYISDRHSSSVLGLPMALQDEDIEVELPIDADDDLIETGKIESQCLRGLSEVSAQLRQIHLRQITAKISTKLYRPTASIRYNDLCIAVKDLLGELDEWRSEFPILTEPRNIYESIQWRDLNYFRERLKCFRLLFIKVDHTSSSDRIVSLDRCHEAAAQIAWLYQSMRASDKLIMNWTCVHDMMSAGFTNLYCGIALRDIAQDDATVGEWSSRSNNIQKTTSAVVDTLSYIAERWPSVKKHAHVFKALATRVEDSMRSAMSLQTMSISSGPVASGNLPEVDIDMAPNSEISLDHQMDTWDSAMAAFLDQPFDLGNIDWGAVDWDAMQLLSDS